MLAWIFDECREGVDCKLPLGETKGIVMSVFDEYAVYYNLFYKDKNYGREAMVIDKLLKKYNENKPVRSILNIGCGSGKHDGELAKLGYTVTGIDQSEAMLDIARHENGGVRPTISYYRADARSFVLDAKFDTAISLFHVMSYINSNEDLLAVFQSVRKVLEKGKLFIFDAWYGPGVLSDKPSVRVRKAEDDTAFITRIALPVMHDKENIVDVNYEIIVVNKKTNEASFIKETHNMRYYFVPEMKWMLKQCGFSLLDVLDSESIQETSYDSWTCYFIASAV